MTEVGDFGLEEETLCSFGIDFILTHELEDLSQVVDLFFSLAENS